MNKSFALVMLATLPAISNFALANTTEITTSTDQEMTRETELARPITADPEAKVSLSEVGIVLKNNGLSPEQIREILGEFHVDYGTIASSGGSVCRGGP